ncbi:MAG: sulfatase-like hydrolase/transferase [Candidatus Sumerlaeia bacterium]|nr:sulfatase-like hydrolase/transferase [Candidatus Sumerlaeia bacterium]
MAIITRKTRREFLRDAACITAGLAGAAVSTQPHPSAASSAPASRLNILYIMTDQQFGDAMSCRMGTRYIHTPAMDSLAETGMVFTRAYSPNPLCMPMRASLFTGRYPHETGVTRNVHVDMKPEHVSMGLYFRRAGYETAYYGKWHLCWNQKDADSHGFDNMTPVADKGLDVDARTAASAAAFLRKKHDKPFLLVASFLNPHNICEYARGQELPCGPIGEAPPPEQCPPAPANLEPPLNEPDSMTMMRKGYHASSLFPVGNFTANDWRRQRWGYYRMIEKVDTEIAKVLAALRESGLENNTLVIFTSDHGDCTGAHRFNQKTVFYEESARIPLIVSLKGQTAKGTTDKLVNIGIDVLPTLLDFAGLPIPKDLPGRSLRPLAMGQPVSDWRDYIVVQNHMDQAGKVGDIRPALEGRMVRTDRWKYCIYSRGQQRESLVDMANDPGETKDLATDPNHRKVLLDHREILAQWAREHNDPLVPALLADNVKPIPFVHVEETEKPKKKQAK